MMAEDWKPGDLARCVRSCDDDPDMDAECGTWCREAA
jgi:hypothetical protein